LTEGVEIDLQLGLMTLQSKHISALDTVLANHSDVKNIFGQTIIQASRYENSSNRKCFRLIGLNHEIHYWYTAHCACPPMADEWEREYDPAQLFDSEKWIVPVSESEFLMIDLWLVDCIHNN